MYGGVGSVFEYFGALHFSCIEMESTKLPTYVRTVQELARDISRLHRERDHFSSYGTVFSLLYRKRKCALFFSFLFPLVPEPNL